MNRLLSFILVFTLYGLDCLSQSDYRQGFIITNKNDTIYGMIDYRGDISNSLSCRFKLNQDDNPTVYYPVDIKAYRFTDDKFYVSKEISKNNKTEFKFVEFLLHGIADLYSYRDQNGVYFYIQKEGEDIIELKEKEINVIMSGYEHTIKQKTYVGYLKSLFADAPNIQNEIDNVILSRKSLIDITQKYHYQVCDDQECIIYKKNLPKVIVGIGPLIGINNHSIFPRTLTLGTINSAYFECNYQNLSSIIYGLFTNISFPYSNGKFSFHHSSIITSYSYNSTYEIRSGPFFYDYSINSTDLSHFFMLKYSPLNWKIKPLFFAGGYGSHKLTLKKRGMDIILSAKEIFPKTTYYGLSAGLGVSYQVTENKEIFIMMLMNRGFGSFDYFNTKEINFALGIPLIHLKSK